MTQIGKYEALLADWRRAQAEVDLLLRFQEDGGEFRLRISTDNGDPAIGRVMAEWLEEGGRRAVLTSSIKRAREKAELARAEFFAESAAQHMLEETGRAPL